MHTAGKLVGLTTIAVLAATATAAPAVDVKARQAATPFGFPLPTDLFSGLDFGFAGPPSTNGQTATASSTPVASAVPEKRQFFPFIPLDAFGIDNYGNGNAGLGDAAGTGSAVESTSTAAPSSAPAKRQFFPFPFPLFDPEESGAGASSGSGGAGAGAGSTVSNTTVPATSGAPEKRQFFPFVDPFLPLEELADNARLQTTNATVPVATDAI